MSKYLYDDEDNAPMNEEAMPGREMSWKLYSEIIREMGKEQPIPFTDQPSEKEMEANGDELP